MIKERNYGIDLLRLVLMFMVCMSHILGQGGILSECVFGSVNYNVYILLEITLYCIGNGFALISGYMAMDKPQKYDKLVNMWFQAFFYSFIITIILTFLGFGDGLSKTDIIKTALPLTFGDFWYYQSFFVLFLAVPLLNKFIFQIDEAAAKKTLIIIVVIFSFVGLPSNSFKTQGGFSTIWIITLYIIGALSKKIKLFETKSNLTLIIIFTSCNLITWGLHILKGINTLVSYISPTILLSSIALVILFSRIKLKGTIISKLSPLVFGVYLFQLNKIVWTILLKDAFTFVASKNIAIGLLYVFAFSSLLFVSGMIVEFIRSKIATLIKLPSLSKIIVAKIDKYMTKLFIFMK